MAFRFSQTSSKPAKSTNLLAKKNPFLAKRLKAKKKQAAEQAEVAAVFSQFTESFAAPSAGQKQAFVRGSDGTRPPRDAKRQAAQAAAARIGASTAGLKRTINKRKPKKSRAIDSFMQELKQSEQRRTLRREGKLAPSPPRESRRGRGGRDRDSNGSYASSGDENTTNLYCGNLPPDINELKVLQVFGQYGPIGSVKIMWPWNDTERTRDSNCGFVSFMERADAETALHHLKGYEVFSGDPMRIGWGKSVKRPPHPLPMPKNIGSAGIMPGATHFFGGEETTEQKVDLSALPKDAVKLLVKIPELVQTRKYVDKCAQFVARDGFAFESVLIQNEGQNPAFQWLVDTQAPEHLYYRWRVHSLAQGDSVTKWRLQPFQVVAGGPFFIPPAIPPAFTGNSSAFTAAQRGTIDQFNSSSHSSHAPSGGTMRDETADELMDKIRKLSCSRKAILDTMVFCLDQSRNAKEVVEIVIESMTLNKTPHAKKLSRLFLVSDILHNSATSSVRGASLFRSEFQACLSEVFDSFHLCLEKLRGADDSATATRFRDDTLKVLRVWHAWALFPSTFLDQLETKFLGASSADAADSQVIDGEPMDDADGEPF